MVVSVRNSKRERDGGFHLGEGVRSFGNRAKKETKHQSEENSISKCQGLCLKSRYILPKILILTARSRTTSFFFQAEDGIRDRSPSRGLGDVYKRQQNKEVWCKVAFRDVN